MREQDILNKIKESADSVEIPESLKPENIEAMLKVKAIEQQADSSAATEKQKSYRFQPKHLMAAAVALVFMLGLVPLGLNMGIGQGKEFNDQVAAGDGCQSGKMEIASGLPEYAQQEEVVEESATEAGISFIEKKQDAGELYVVARNEDEVHEYIKSIAAEYRNSYYGIMTDDVVYDLVAIPEAAEDGLATGSVSEKESSASEPMGAINGSVNSTEAPGELEFSTTNLQMAGVDESDIVKTNGTHLFVVKDEKVFIMKVENGMVTKVGTISPKLASFSDRILEMYVDGDNLVLIVQQTKEEMASSVSGTGTSSTTGTVEAPVKTMLDVAYNYTTTFQTVLYTYDISNPAKPVELGKIEQDGNYKTSRKIDDVVYLFTYEMVGLEVIFDDNTQWAEALPKVNGENFTFDSIYLPERGAQGLVVSSISLDNPDEVVDKTLIMNNYVEIYVSSDAMYLYNYNYLSGEELTEIAKFSLKAGRISAVGATSVPGSIQDTFAINEYKGNLRVLTTGWNIGGSRERTNQLYILDKNLEPAGRIENIAPGESIYAARYFGDLAYFITYRNMDPLFAADLSDIQNPKLLGELEITGYSEYLHMWGEDKLLGIGYETDPKDGSREGVKLVMFDISNPAELSIIDTVVLENEDYSAAMFDYKCVLADANANIIGFTTAEYNDYEVDYRVYSFVDGEFKEELVEELGNVASENRIRGLYIGDYFYIVDSGWVGSYTRKDAYKAVSELEFN